MNPKLIANVAKYGMWALIELLFIGWFVMAVVRGDPGASFFMGLCFVLLLGIPLAMTRVQGH